MFELGIACKYLIPTWRQLSVSIISLVSTLVIALVVWLIVVFFSVKDGLENSWIEKIVALTAPIRITPTENYYRSYYYLIDSISSNSDYTTKSIGEKWKSTRTDPYDILSDEELPTYWPEPDLNAHGTLKDLVQEVFQLTLKPRGITNLQANDYETAIVNLKLTLRHGNDDPSKTQQLDQTAYLGSFDTDNPIIAKAIILPVSSKSPLSVLILPDKKGISMPPRSAIGDPILLPKAFKDVGALIGDQGHISYYTPTPSTIQEQRAPVFVAGFYDPGIMPMGGKYILADKNLIGLIRSSYNPEDALHANGINIRFDEIAEAPRIKQELQQDIIDHGLAPYWHVESYQDYEFSKDLIQQLQSEKNLFGLISLIIIFVACSNIISMLIILVNDKKLEIGILRSMGTTSLSIATIFGFCGMVMGALGSLIGIALAILTLRNVNELVDFISRIQGHELFNPVFYGNTLPTELSMEALLFVIITTAFISLLAGIIPAIKASTIHPSAILKAE